MAHGAMGLLFSNFPTGRCICPTTPIKARSRRIPVEGRVYSLVRGLRLRHSHAGALQCRGLPFADSEDGHSMELATARGDIRARNVVAATGPFKAPKFHAQSRITLRPFSDTLARLSKPLSTAARCHIGCRQWRVRHADRRGTSSRWSQGDPGCRPISQDPPSASRTRFLLVVRQARLLAHAACVLAPGCKKVALCRDGG